MTEWTRRGLIVATGAMITGACSGGTNSGMNAQIDQDVGDAIQKMTHDLPYTQQLADRSAGMLVIPGIRKAGFVIGASYGEGALMIGDTPVDYYSVLAGSVGYQAGYQKITQVLFFLDEESLRGFRSRNGWTLGADLEFTVIDTANNFGVETITHQTGIHALTVDQSGVLLGASLEGAKYSRVIR